MPGRIDPNNPLLSVVIGSERKKRVIKASEKDKVNLTLYINRMIDKWFEVIERNAQ